MNALEYAESPEYTQIYVLSRMRLVCDIPMQAVAAEMGVSKSLLSLLESGKRRASPETIKKYSDAIQTMANLKGRFLYENIVSLSERHRITDEEARKSPAEFLYRYLRACCAPADRKID